MAGAHVPVMPLVEVVGKAAIEAPEQNGPTEANTGTTWSLITMVRVVLVPHWPASGVKEYVVVTVLLMAGAHVPEMPFEEVVGSAGIEAPEQYGPTEANAGTTWSLITMVRVVLVPH